MKEKIIVLGLKQIFSLMLLFVSINVYSQPLNQILNSENNPRFQYDTLSNVLYTLPAYNAKIKIDGSEIKDGENNILATLGSADGNIYDMNNDFIGKINSNGEVYDINNHKIGAINPDGSITDASGYLIFRYIGSIPKGLIAYFIFFSDLI